MSPLLERAWREVVRFRWQALGLTALVGLVLTSVVGRVRARGMIVGTLDAVVERLDGADLEVRCLPGDRARLVESAKVEGVADAEARLLVWGRMTFDGQRTLPAVVRLLPVLGPRLGRLELLDGRLPRADEQAVVIDRSLRALNGIEIGDQVTVQVEEIARTLPVVGVSLTPELLVAPAHPQHVLPLRGTLAVICVSAAAVEGIESAEMATSVLVRLAPGADPDAVAARLRQVVALRATDVIPAAERPSRQVTDTMISALDVYTTPIRLALCSLGALLCVLTLGRIARRQRRQIGTLLALGHRPFPIIASFLLLPTFVAVGGGVIAFLLCGWKARQLAGAVAALVGLPPLEDPGAGATPLIAGAAALAVTLLATSLPVWRLTRLSPARALKPSAWDGRAVRRLSVRLASFFTARLPVVLALALTQVIRRRRETLGAVLGLGSALALLLAFLMIHEAQQREVDAVVGRWSRDATVHFHEPVDGAVLDRMARAVGGRVEPYVSQQVLVDRDGLLLHRRVVGMPQGGLAADLPLAAGRPLGGPFAPEALIDHWMASHDELSVGDEVLLLPSPDSPDGTQLSIVGLIDGISFGRMVIPLEVSRSLHDLPGQATGVHVASPLPSERLAAVLWDVEGAEAVITTQEMRRGVASAWQARSRVVFVAIVVAALAAFLFLGILAALDAGERLPELALLQALGWPERSIFVLLMTEVLIRGALTVAAAALLASPLANWMAGRLAAGHGYCVVPTAGGWIFGVVLGTTLLVTAFGALPAWRVARRLPPARVLKTLGRE